MGRNEFKKIMAYLNLSCGKTATADTTEVYYDLLNDLPVEVLQLAVKKACLENLTGFLPPVGVIRAIAVRIMAGPEMTCGEAWAIAKRTAARFGLDQKNLGLATMPTLVRQAVEAFGWHALCDMPVDGSTYDWDRWQKIFLPLQTRQSKQGLLPPKIAEMLGRIGNIPEQIGVMP